MNKKERAIKLLDRIPEEKMDDILGVLEEAALPVQPLNAENISAFFENDNDEDMDALCAALENMAGRKYRCVRIKVTAYLNRQIPEISGCGRRFRNFLSHLGALSGYGVS